MTKRIKTEILFAPYMGRGEPLKVSAYQTREGSLFAAAKAYSRATSWDLRHVESGLSMGSVLPSRAYTLAEVLAVISAIEAHTELDMRAFEKLEFGVGFDPKRRPSADLLTAIREIARAAL